MPVGDRQALRYRTKSTIVEAVEYAGHGNLHPRYKGEIPGWMWQAFEDKILVPTNGDDPLYVAEPEGWAELHPLDWLVREPTGQLRVYKPWRFKATFEPDQFPVVRADPRLMDR